MGSRTTILLVTAEASTAGAVSAALGEEGRFLANGVCQTLHDLAGQLQRKPAPAALVDIDPDPARMLEELERLIGRFTQTRFVVLSSSLQNDLLLAAMQAGARHFMLKEAIASELPQVLSRLVPEEAAGRSGMIVTVLSAGGGCGATTLAINLAEELHQLTCQPTMLIDMDLGYGAVAAYLGLQGQYGLADVLAYNGRIDPQLVLSTAVGYGQGLHVLVSPVSVSFSAPVPLTYRNLDRALKACAKACPCTVIDAPRMPMEITAALAGQSLAALVVFQLNVKDIRVARTMVSALVECGVRPERVLPVANRWRRRGQMVSLDEAGRALGGVALRRVRNDFPNAIRSMNYGRPVAQAAPRSDLARDIRQLAEELLAWREAGSPAGGTRRP